ncbi:DUF998 domain-containing protein [Elioraea sp.]|uniref:DUF998 domain-containing protein n=1 Tax=Elioraea sp. TaxID=2185103 RepID=UPI0025BB09E9|nr:DUF998 domain-containing protein [Elioraea sp.]
MSDSAGSQKLLPLMAILAVVIYGVGDVVSGLLYTGYSFRDQAISELTAFGSPVRAFMMTIMLAHGGLLVIFGVCLFRSACSRALRWTGALVSAANLVTLPTHTIWAMSSRGMQTGVNDTLHAQTTIAFSLLVGAAVALSAIAIRGWFRPFAFVALAVIIAFGVAASGAMTGITEDDTPWAGAYERINCYVYFLWLVVLALLAPREFPPSCRETARETA